MAHPVRGHCTYRQRALLAQTDLNFLIFLPCLVVFQLAITAVPSRSEFYRRISQGGSYENLDAELAKWLKGLNQIVVRMKRFLAEGGYGTV